MQIARLSCAVTNRFSACTRRSTVTYGVVLRPVRGDRKAARTQMKEEPADHHVDAQTVQLKDCGAYQSENRRDARQTPPRGGVVPLHRKVARLSSRVGVYFLSEIYDREDGLLSVQPSV